ncbi:14571_t:CDS:2 [Racocetra fulgida]|uniref:14571_t:CDS:1 n=1 Tax=Racocetra fulgida TaxID=60492 RepID=A0A9N8W409_9GLOM|nr:14571_t:CDS:2 [Racocetra fulgida]
MNRQIFKSLFIFFLIHLLALNIDARHKYHPKSSKTCTITDISDTTVTITIPCSTEIPALSACPDRQQVSNNCKECEQKTTVTCTPTTTVCISTPTCLPDGAPCTSDDQCCFPNVGGCCAYANYTFTLHDYGEMFEQGVQTEKAAGIEIKRQTKNTRYLKAILKLIYNNLK